MRTRISHNRSARENERAGKVFLQVSANICKYLQYLQIQNSLSPGEASPYLLFGRPLPDANETPHQTTSFPCGLAAAPWADKFGSDQVAVRSQGQDPHALSMPEGIISSSTANRQAIFKPSIQLSFPAGGVINTPAPCRLRPWLPSSLKLRRTSRRIRRRRYKHSRSLPVAARNSQRFRY